MVRLVGLCEQENAENIRTILLHIQELDRKEVGMAVGEWRGEVGGLGLALGIWEFLEPGTWENIDAEIPHPSVVEFKCETQILKSGNLVPGERSDMHRKCISQIFGQYFLGTKSAFHEVGTTFGQKESWVMGAQFSVSAEIGKLWRWETRLFLNITALCSL